MSYAEFKRKSRGHNDLRINIHSLFTQAYGSAAVSNPVNYTVVARSIPSTNSPTSTTSNDNHTPTLNSIIDTPSSISFLFKPLLNLPILYWLGEQSFFALVIVPLGFGSWVAIYFIAPRTYTVTGVLVFLLICGSLSISPRVDRTLLRAVLHSFDFWYVLI